MQFSILLNHVIYGVDSEVCFFGGLCQVRVRLKLGGI